MGRRGLHNEGSQTLNDRLDGKIEIDFDTARRIFTLICVLHSEMPKSVLFVCNMNQIRSPMAEFLMQNLFGDKIYAQSAGIYAGDEDGFMQAVMRERSIDASSHEPETLEQLEDSFVDLVITLTSQAPRIKVRFGG